MKIYLEHRDDESAKFWEIEVDGDSYTVRFGKLGAAGRKNTKTFASPEKARAEADKLIAQKRAKGYEPTRSQVAAAPAGWTGAVFFAEANDVTANALLSALREDGKLSKKNPRSLSGFGKDGLVGVAIHQPRGGYWAVVDSADGSQGINVGAWSRIALMANHLSTDALWYRAFSDDLAVAIQFYRGGSFFEVLPGSRQQVETWLSAKGVDLSAAVPPALAGDDVTVATLEYNAEDYRSGPAADTAAGLAAIGSALVVGDASAVRDHYDRLPTEALALALGVIRGARDGAWRQCLAALAEQILTEPMRPRDQAKEMTFAEEVLRRAAESGDEAMFERCLDRLDAIEAEAEGRSSWAQPNGVWKLAAVSESASVSRAFQCYRRLLCRSDAPHWIIVNKALWSVVASSSGQVVLEGDALDVVRRAEARVKDVGESAQDAIHYNLACVHARAGRSAEALDRLQKVHKLREQNPHPDADTDLEILWEEPAFRALLAAEPSEIQGDVAADKADEHSENIEIPKDRQIPRLTIRLSNSDDGNQLVSRLGGLPNAPPNTAWPESASRPMQLVLQLVGTAAGGEIDLGDVHVLQVFADLDSDYYHPSCHTVVLHRSPCDAALDPPVGIDVAPARAMAFSPGYDDRVLLDLEYPDEAASSHAWADKIWGIPVGANLDPDQRDSKGEPMTCVLQLVSYDDWFLWCVFTSRDFSEARLLIVRG